MVVNFFYITKELTSRDPATPLFGISNFCFKKIMSNIVQEKKILREQRNLLFLIILKNKTHTTPSFAVNIFLLF